MKRGVLEFERLLALLGDEIKFDIPLQQLRLLLIVALNPGITQTELSERLGLHQATISRNVKKMSEDHIVADDGTIRTVGWGLLQSRQDTRFDSRRLAVFLTKKGEKVIAKFQAALESFSFLCNGEETDGDKIGITQL